MVADDEPVTHAVTLTAAPPVSYARSTSRRGKVSSSADYVSSMVTRSFSLVLWRLPPCAPGGELDLGYDADEYIRCAGDFRGTDDRRGARDRWRHAPATRARPRELRGRPDPRRDRALERLRDAGRPRTRSSRATRSSNCSWPTCATATSRSGTRVDRSPCDGCVACVVDPETERTHPGRARGRPRTVVGKGRVVVQRFGIRNRV